MSAERTLYARALEQATAALNAPAGSGGAGPGGGRPVLLIGSQIERPFRMAFEAADAVEPDPSARVDQAWIRSAYNDWPAPPCPVRAPHYTVSLAGLLGTPLGRRYVPGECNLAHGGVLVLDEAASFRIEWLTAIERVWRRGAVHHYSPSNPASSVNVPARFRLIGTCLPLDLDRLRRSGIPWVMIQC